MFDKERHTIMYQPVHSRHFVNNQVPSFDSCFCNGGMYAMNGVDKLLGENSEDAKMQLLD